ncbi:peripheral plasma membrane protein CASK-like isoform X3 [Varroa jacobsoni]|uniref:peripheral plasma membrane protein CASK-like isoform X3 n=1 Tax=Varroa jacobsoni TaxID=62625 RepID=UPI000BF80D18|nr:peripheral plasma membrane protein CASK-like isoform X3 [Varroa jacobsoni]
MNNWHVEDALIKMSEKVEVIFEEVYHVYETTEKGSCWVQRRCVHRETGRQFSVKIVDVAKIATSASLDIEDIKREATICHSLKHSHIVELLETYSSEGILYMVFEFMEGSDLFMEVVSRACAGFVYSETVASYYMRQILSAVRYCHQRDVIHRDIRPHCVLLATKDTSAPVKLYGFSHAIRLDEQISLTQHQKRVDGNGMNGCHFSAPEVLRGLGYGKPSDIWSCGVLLYTLLCGSLPFNGTGDRLEELICRTKYVMSGPIWDAVSSSAKDLVSKMLVHNPLDRYTAVQLLEHPWIRQRDTHAPSEHLHATVEQLYRFNTCRKLKGLVLSAVSSEKWLTLSLCVSSPINDNNNDVDLEQTTANHRLEEFLSNRAVSVIIESLDDLECLSDPNYDPVMLDNLFTEQRFISLLQLYDKIHQQCLLPPRDLPDEDASLIAQEGDVEGWALRMTIKLYHTCVIHHIRCLFRFRCHQFVDASTFNQIAEWIEETPLGLTPEMEELHSILSKPYLRSLLQAHDVVAHEIFGDGAVPLTPPPQTATLTTTLSSSTGGCLGGLGGTLEGALPIAFGSGIGLGAISGIGGVGGTPLQMNGGIGMSPLGAVAGRSDVRRLQSSGTTSPEGLLDDNDPTNITTGQQQNQQQQQQHITRIRLVQFQKNTDEPMGITLKVDEEGRCIVARIMHGGMIHKQATLHVGDEIIEINGISVANQTVESLQRLLRDARGSVTFKIVPTFRSVPPLATSGLPQTEMYIKCMFNYDPIDDELIPCTQAGISFRIGQILQVINKEDANWWQVRKCSPEGPSGLVPSPELQEWRLTQTALENAKNDKYGHHRDSTNCSIFRKRKKEKEKQLAAKRALADDMDLSCYEEVMKVPAFRRNTLVLLGAHGVGRRHIKNTLIGGNPERYAYPIPHTTRPQRRGEENGHHYFFVHQDEMLRDIATNQYLEYGGHEGAMYGTKLDTIRRIINSGKMAILDVEPQALKMLRCAEFTPFVVFIAAPPLGTLHDVDGSLERLNRESTQLANTFGRWFDLTIVNSDIGDTIHQLREAAELIHLQEQWVPVTWVYR